jgi:hypothetical protein
VRSLLCILALLFYSAEYLPPRTDHSASAMATSALVVGAIYSTIPIPPIRAQSFFASSSWTCPAGVTTAYLSGCGAGGGGGGGTTTVSQCGGGGGGGDAVLRQDFPVVPGTVYTVTINAGGSGGTTGGVPTAGAVGGTTVFGALLTLAGGLGGGIGSATAGLGGAAGGPGGWSGSDGTTFGGLGGGNLFAPGTGSYRLATGTAANYRGPFGNGGPGGVGGSGQNGTAGRVGMILVEW